MCGIPECVAYESHLIDNMGFETPGCPRGSGVIGIAIGGAIGGVLLLGGVGAAIFQAQKNKAASASKLPVAQATAMPMATATPMA